MIDSVCYVGNYYRPRMYRKKARADYLALAKCRKRTTKRIQKAIKAQLQYVRRDIAYLEALLEKDDVILKDKWQKRFEVIKELYEQQKYIL